MVATQYMPATFIRQRINPSTLPATLVAKWGAKVLFEGFVPLPKRLLRCATQILSGPDALEQLMLLMAIADYLRPNLSRGPSREFLAFVSGLPVDRVNNILDRLVVQGLITVSDKGSDELDIAMTGLWARIEALTPSEDED